MDKVYTVLNFNALVATNPLQDKVKVKGLRLEVSKQEKYTENSKIVFLDMEEIEALTKAIDYLSSKLTEYAKEERSYTEIEYTSNDGLQIGFAQEKLKQTLYLQIGKVSPIMMLPRDIYDLVLIRKSLDSASTLLKSK
jgi:hypothetical protein